MSYVRRTILYGSEAWCLKQRDIVILQTTVRPMFRAMCGVQLKDRKKAKNMMLGLNETIIQLAMVNSVP